ncbi:lysophospholipid acyltransferase family protein [Reinekea forsetii]|uniref:lysophospholipid acyltransferase family protein n=1 Tax=Reinekea forsetii TaxID=1336806 RepID=UPI0023521884|nr:lysophospholipid acyltransferase family protein [Reinekea forsetii]
MLYIPPLPDNWDSFGNRFTRWLGRTLFGALGWSFAGELPNQPKLMFVVAPHTSNWDFFIGLFGMLAIGFKGRWLGKHSLFVWPIKGLMTRLGGIPVYRHAPRGMVEQVVDQYQQHARLHLAVTPEGTRAKVGKFKNGFLRIAIGAGIPIAPVGFDYREKKIVFGELFYPTGDLIQDERTCYQYFTRFTAKYPQNY